jgi:coproporphyrinogen III oxidase-like Fe-S oxidoreductase
MTCDWRRRPNCYRQKWLKSVEEFGSGETVRSQISEVEQVEEYGLMGLRLTAGVDKAILALHPNFTKNINYLYDNELLQTAEGVVSATEKGRPLLNAILRQLFT